MRSPLPQVSVNPPGPDGAQEKDIQIDGVADPGVHPLPAGRAVDMGRVSKQLVAAGGELAALGGEMGPHAAPVAFRRSP
jgi:hypothetical protein